MRNIQIIHIIDVYVHNSNSENNYNYKFDNRKIEKSSFLIVYSSSPVIKKIIKKYHLDIFYFYEFMIYEYKFGPLTLDESCVGMSSSSSLMTLERYLRGASKLVHSNATSQRFIATPYIGDPYVIDDTNWNVYLSQPLLFS